MVKPTIINYNFRVHVPNKIFCPAVVQQILCSVFYPVLYFFCHICLLASSNGKRRKQPCLIKSDGNPPEVPRTSLTTAGLGYKERQEEFISPYTGPICVSLIIGEKRTGNTTENVSTDTSFRWFSCLELAVRR